MNGQNNDFFSPPRKEKKIDFYYQGKRQSSKSNVDRHKCCNKNGKISRHHSNVIIIVD